MRSVRSRLIQRFVLMCLVGSLALSSASCFTSSSLQSARMLGKDEVEVTPSYSSQNISDNGEMERIAHQYGVQVGIGQSQTFNTRLRYERIDWDDNISDGGFNFVAIEPKLGLIPDALAVSVPVGFWIGDDIEGAEAFQFHPSVHLTQVLFPNLELNGSAKVLIFTDDPKDMIALNVGLGLGDPDRVVIRPEVGWLFSPGDDGHYFHWSIGLSLYRK